MNLDKWTIKAQEALQRAQTEARDRNQQALAPMHLGIKGVIALSFARIHRANLINFGILPLTFSRAEDLDRIRPGDHMEIDGAAKAVKEGRGSLHILNKTQGYGLDVAIQLDERERDIVVAGGRLNHFRLHSL